MILMIGGKICSTICRKLIQNLFQQGKSNSFLPYELCDNRLHNKNCSQYGSITPVLVISPFLKVFKHDFNERWGNIF